MEPFVLLIRELGSFGLVAGIVVYTMFKIKPSFDKLNENIAHLSQVQEKLNTYIELKNGSLEKHMVAQDKAMERMLTIMVKK